MAMTAASGLAGFPFSGDAGTLSSRLEEMQAKLNRRPLNLPTCPKLTDLQAIRIAKQMGAISPESSEYSDDENGRVVDGLEKAIDLKLTDPSYRNMLKYGLSSQAEINVPPGRYKLQAVVRESNQARIGSQSKLIEIP